MSEYIRYFGYFGWLLVLNFLASRLPIRLTVKERIDDVTVTRYNWLFALVVGAPLIYFAATRTIYIGDTNAYKKILELAPSALNNIPEYMNSFYKDRWFYGMTALIKHFFGYRPVVYFFIIAVLQILLMTKTLRKYSCDLLISFFVFVASADYLSFMHNGIRQFIAVCILFGAAELIFERKYIPAIIMALIASQFHETALLMIPLIFIVQGEPWNKSTVAVLLLSLMAVAFVGTFTEVLDHMLEETNYSNIVSDWIAWNDDGTNPIRVAVFCVPAVLSMIGINYIREENDPVINICTNMSVISAGLYIVSMVTSGLYIGRLPIYVSLYANCILLPWEINHFFNRKSADFIKVMMIICFLLFYYFQVHFTWGVV